MIFGLQSLTSPQILLRHHQSIRMRIRRTIVQDMEDLPIYPLERYWSPKPWRIRKIWDWKKRIFFTTKKRREFLLHSWILVRLLIRSTVPTDYRSVKPSKLGMAPMLIDYRMVALPENKSFNYLFNDYKMQKTLLSFSSINKHLFLGDVTT